MSYLFVPEPAKNPATALITDAISPVPSARLSRYMSTPENNSSEDAIATRYLCISCLWVSFFCVMAVSLSLLSFLEAAISSAVSCFLKNLSCWRSFSFSVIDASVTPRLIKFDDRLAMFSSTE